MTEVLKTFHKYSKKMKKKILKNYFAEKQLFIAPNETITQGIDKAFKQMVNVFV